MAKYRVYRFLTNRPNYTFFTVKKHKIISIYLIKNEM